MNLCGSSRFFIGMTTLLTTILIQSSLPVHAIDISLQKDAWHLFKYQTIPAHRLIQQNDGLKLVIKRSASPVVHAFPAAVSARNLSVKAQIIGTLKLDTRPQGSRGADDFRLRVGVVYRGDKQLDPFQLSVAPTWIKQIYSLLPADTGISHVQFFNTYLDQSIAGVDRIHPTTPLWRERFTLKVDDQGVIEQQLVLDPGQQVVGIWISADGDDTGSCFDVVLQKLALDSEPGD